MKNIIVFEGIASSGKTTVERLLVERLRDAVVISEGETLMPIIDNADIEVSRGHLRRQLEVIAGRPEENVIVDRFHFTHAFRTRSPLEAFYDIETELQKIGRITVVLLTMNPGRIKERIEETVGFRQDGWKKGKQGSVEEKIAYYVRQQEILKSFATFARLPVIEIDTTGKDWGTYVDRIVRVLELERTDVSDK